MNSKREENSQSRDSAVGHHHSDRAMAESDLEKETSLKMDKTKKPSMKSAHAHIQSEPHPSEDKNKD